MACWTLFNITLQNEIVLCAWSRVSEIYRNCGEEITDAEYVYQSAQATAKIIIWNL